MANNIASKTVLLVMDIQKAMVESLPDGQTLLNNLKEAVAAARSSNIPVVYAMVAFRKDYPEISSNNMRFTAAKQSGSLLLNDDKTHIHPDIAPEGNEPVVVKKRISAFTGSDLEIMLRAMKAEHLIMAGISTSGVVLSTTREASDKDFKLTILEDCCADKDASTHDFLVNKILKTQAEITTAKEWVASLKS